VDVWKKGDEVRALTKIETDTLRLMREVFEGNAVVEIPSLKTQDGRKIGEEVKLVDGLMHNLIRPKMTVTEVNRLLYAGSYVVAYRLGLIRRKKVEVKKKPWWQRRLEWNIKEWRKDLGRVNEIKKGSNVRKVVKDRLERKYKLMEKGTIAVSTLLKNKITSASTKIRQYVGKSIARRQNISLRTTKPVCTRN